MTDHWADKQKKKEKRTEQEGGKSQIIGGGGRGITPSPLHRASILFHWRLYHTMKITLNEDLKINQIHPA